MSIEAIRKAKEILERGGTFSTRCHQALEVLDKALAQPEQKGHCTCGEPEALGVVHFRTRPCFHYIHQPKREWVGLTDEDLKPLCDEWRIMYGGYVDDFARAIEAKLKEKNHG